MSKNEDKIKEIEDRVKRVVEELEGNVTQENVFSVEEKHKIDELYDVLEKKDSYSYPQKYVLVKSFHLLDTIDSSLDEFKEWKNTNKKLTNTEQQYYNIVMRSTDTLLTLIQSIISSTPKN